MRRPRQDDEHKGSPPGGEAVLAEPEASDSLERELTKAASELSECRRLEKQADRVES